MLGTILTPNKQIIVCISKAIKDIRHFLYDKPNKPIFQVHISTLHSNNITHPKQCNSKINSNWCHMDCKISFKFMITFYLGDIICNWAFVFHSDDVPDKAFRSVTGMNNTLFIRYDADSVTSDILGNFVKIAREEYKTFGPHQAMALASQNQCKKMKITIQKRHISISEQELCIVPVWQGIEFLQNKIHVICNHWRKKSTPKREISELNLKYQSLLYLTETKTILVDTWGDF